jgi:hypothetical protein
MTGGTHLPCLPRNGAGSVTLPVCLTAERWFAQRKRESVAGPGNREIDQHRRQPVRSQERRSLPVVKNSAGMAPGQLPGAIPVSSVISYAVGQGLVMVWAVLSV